MSISAFARTNNIALYCDRDYTGPPWQHFRAGDVIEFVAWSGGRTNVIHDRTLPYMLSIMDSHVTNSIIDLKDCVSQFTAQEVKLITRDHDILGIPYETIPAILCFILLPYLWKQFSLFKSLAGISATIYMLFSLLFNSVSIDMPRQQYWHHFALYWAHYLVLPLFVLESDWFHRILTMAFVWLFFIRSSINLYTGVLEKRWLSLFPVIPLVISVYYNAGAEVWTCLSEMLVLHIRLALYLVLLRIISQVDNDFASYHANAIRSPKKFLEMLSLCLVVEAGIMMLANTSFSFTMLSNAFRFVLFWSVFYNAAFPSLRKSYVAWVSFRPTSHYGY